MTVDSMRKLLPNLKTIEYSSKFPKLYTEKLNLFAIENSSISLTISNQAFGNNYQARNASVVHLNSKTTFKWSRLFAWFNYFKVRSLSNEYAIMNASSLKIENISPQKNWDDKEMDDLVEGIEIDESWEAWIAVLINEIEVLKIIPYQNIDFTPIDFQKVKELSLTINMAVKGLKGIRNLVCLLKSNIFQT
jgi:hypothetical protein